MSKNPKWPEVLGALLGALTLVVWRAAITTAVVVLVLRNMGVVVGVGIEP